MINVSEGAYQRMYEHFYEWLEVTTSNINSESVIHMAGYYDTEDPEDMQGLLEAQWAYVEGVWSIVALIRVDNA